MKRTTRILLLSAAALALPLAAFAARPLLTTRPVTTTAKPAMMKTTPTHGVDLNQAPRAELLKLAGVNETLADAIIAGRPYTSKADLLDRKIVDAKTYRKLSRHLILKAPATPPAGR